MAKRGRLGTTISSQHQITIPVAALHEAGLQVGDRLVASSDGPGRIVLVREDDMLGRFQGALTGCWQDGGEVGALSDEWR